MSNEQHGGGGFVAGLLVGAILGGAAAYFLTQEEARDLLVGKAREAGNFATDASGDLRGKVNDVASQWQSGAADLYERGRSVVENARSNMNDAVNDGVDAADHLRDQLHEKAEG